MYADQMTDSMRTRSPRRSAAGRSSSSTTREHGIDPQTVRKKVTDILEMIRARDGDDDAAGRARAGPGSRPRRAASGPPSSTCPACRPTSSVG